jgi:Zn-finger nucleic acid-binding protein
LQVYITELKVSSIFIDVCDPRGMWLDIERLERLHFLLKHAVFCTSF